MMSAWYLTSHYNDFENFLYRFIYFFKSNRYPLEGSRGFEMISLDSDGSRALLAHVFFLFLFFVLQKRSRIAYSDEVRNELLGDDGNSSEIQRAHLLDNTERLERSSRRLEAGYQIAVETEQIGQDILENLSHDREKIQRARERLRETDANLGKSSRILTGMIRRVIQNRILVVILGIIVFLAVVMIVYFTLRPH
uniref:t-SNARE coiled-coil homology domain-containing protein n=1 Tax=Anolis carolinensis TaxID=28377 RepID=A0A803SRB8_ANOCA|nr:PREDICTED: vesicle transport through interaction with t-SNAREs homolog 1A isoform X2 [Anolis carolinensis]|eukprot:XP_016850559.1 PREDICTED: vesicle transport through interaction with t-SNAREs homolog 1A isoform X2 [Anolis carolinensis]